MSLRDIEICAECGEPRHRHRDGAPHQFSETDLRHERDRHLIARVQMLSLTDLERMLGTVREEWEWWCVQRAIAAKKRAK